MLDDVVVDDMMLVVDDTMLVVDDTTLDDVVDDTMLDDIIVMLDTVMLDTTGDENDGVSVSVTELLLAAIDVLLLLLIVLLVMVREGELPVVEATIPLVVDKLGLIVTDTHELPLLVYPLIQL